jgi:uncharacterized YigZ family protein
MVYWLMMSTRIHFNTSKTLVIKHSEFITHLERVFSFEEAKAILWKLRSQHPEATHITYAYRSHNEERTGDDGEVPGTAGKTELKVLKEQDITDILAVVIRYYGGTNLGINGLIHAYMDSVIQALKTTTLCDLIEMNEIQVRIPIEKIDLIRKYNKESLKETVFDEDGFGAVMRFVSQDPDLMKSLSNQTLGTAVLLSQKTILDEVPVSQDP